MRCMPIPFRDDILEQIRPVMEYVLFTIMITSFLLDIAIFKWRKLVNGCLYLEMTYLTLTTLFGTLTVGNETSMLIMGSSYIVNFLIFYCNSGGQIIFSCLLQTIYAFIVLPVIFEDDLNLKSILAPLTIVQIVSIKL